MRSRYKNILKNKFGRKYQSKIRNVKKPKSTLETSDLAYKTKMRDEIF